jgi:signal transduction histidine kinase
MEKSVDLRFEAELAGPLLVAGDPLRFRQIIVNLVDNALKFTSRGTVTVFLKWTPPTGPAQPGKLAIRVQDTGIGIPPERLKDLFQMFTQAEASTTRRYGGSGLGLAICQRLVLLMGGQITVRSAPGAGSEFSFVVPLAPFSLPGENVAAIEPRIAGGQEMTYGRSLQRHLAHFNLPTAFTEWAPLAQDRAGWRKLVTEPPLHTL